MSINKKRKSSTIFWIVISIIGGCILLSAIWFWYIGRYDGVDLYPPEGVEAFQAIRYYKINPRTIFTSLDNKEPNTFTPESIRAEDPVSQEFFSWHQVDHLKIAGALHQFVWNETLDNWNLYAMHFNTACRDNPDGFEFGEFLFFRAIPYKLWIKDYEVRGMQITPQYGDVALGETEYYPGPISGEWKSINLGKINVTAEEALHIAEANGGREARLSIQNNCRIRVRLSGDSSWWIRITDNNSGSEVFSLEIDPYKER